MCAAWEMAVDAWTRSTVAVTITTILTQPASACRVMCRPCLRHGEDTGGDGDDDDDDVDDDDDNNTETTALIMLVTITIIIFFIIMMTIILKQRP